MVWYLLTAIGTAIVCIPLGAWLGFLVLMEALKQDDEVQREPYVPTTYTVTFPPKTKGE